MNTTVKNTSKRPISRSAVVRIVIWSVVLLILCSVFALSLGGILFRNARFGLFSFGGYTYDNPRSYSVGGATVADERITEIDIDWLDGDIEILPTDGAEIVISEDYDGRDSDYRLRWRIRRGELEIKFQKSAWSIGFVNSDPPKKLTVLVPRDMLENMNEVQVETVRSNVTFQGNAEELSFDSVEGNLYANGHIGELEISSVEAEVHFDGALRECNIDGVSINATLRLREANLLEVDGVDNSVHLYLSDAVTGFRLENDALGDKTTINGFDNVEYRGKSRCFWGDESFRIEADGISTQLKIEKLTDN